jgi:uncharacterized OsmC-like protein
VDVRHERVEGADRIRLELRFGGPLEASLEERLRAVAGRCPVHRLLAEQVEITER